MEKHPLNQSDLNFPSKRQRQDDEPLHNDEAAAQDSSENQPYNDEFLCNDCQVVDWSSLPTLAADGLLEKRNLDLRPVRTTIEKLRNSSCRTCAMLSITQDPRHDGKRCVLTALPLSRQHRYNGLHLPEDSASQCVVLNTVWDTKTRDDRYCSEERCLAVLKIDDIGACKIAPSSIDYSNLKDLMKTCEKEHKTCCGTDRRPNVTGLEVIDTKTQEVIKAPDGCEYLALSYMWGKEADKSSTHDIQNSPAVIRDAISVTNSMGYSYLWVDRYCISDPKEKARMISQMDQIYTDASLTIIAAADGDTELGLCGVSMPRQIQRQVIIKDVALLELPQPSAALKSSKWATRGWTYQEGFLSRRRLIFTKTQVLFLCNAMYAAESLQKLLSANCSAGYTYEFHGLIPRFNAAMQRKLSARDLLNQIIEYSRRELTRSSDSLNAILGVLSYYAKTSANLTSPVIRLPWGLIANKYAKKNCFSLHFFWFHEELPIRRTGFPSWSWTGWGGPLSFRHEEVILQPEHAAGEGDLSYLDWKLSMRDEDGKALDMYDLAWKEFEARKSPRRLYQPGPKQLLVSCLVIPLIFQEVDLTKDQKKRKTEIWIHDTGEIISSGRDIPSGSLPTLQAWEGIYVASDIQRMKLDQQIDEKECIMGLIFVGRRADWDTYCCILAREADRGLYERIGLLQMGNLPRFDTRIVYKVYLDDTGTVLDEFTISDAQRRHPFADTAERRTICLV